MRKKSFRSTAFSAFLLCTVLILSACGQPNYQENTKVDSSKTVSIDTTALAIIPFDKQRNFPFDSTYAPANLTAEDIAEIDSILTVCVTDYNYSQENNPLARTIDLKNTTYAKQIVGATNAQSQKEVWLNCFCRAWDNNNWRKEILFVMDGGSCYFNLKINLATKTCFGLSVNGEA